MFDRLRKRLGERELLNPIGGLIIVDSDLSDPDMPVENEQLDPAEIKKTWELVGQFRVFNDQVERDGGITDTTRAKVGDAILKAITIIPEDQVEPKL